MVGFVDDSDFLTMHNPVAQPAVMAPKVIPKGKDKDMGEGKSKKPKAHWMLSNKKLHLDLALAEKLKRNRPGKAFNAVGWEKILKAFNERAHVQYEYLQFKNPYGHQV